MTEKSAMFVFVVGLLMTVGAAGGIENSTDTSTLLSCMVVAIVGLLTMYAGSLGIRNSNYY